MQKRRFALAAALLLSANAPQLSYAFTPSSHLNIYSSVTSTSLYSSQKRLDDESHGDKRVSKHPLNALKPVSLALLTAASAALFPAPNAMASAPVTPIKNFKPPDSKAIALKKINDARNQEKMREQMAYQIKCEEIEETEGKDARIAYEKAHEEKKIQEAEERSVNRKKLLYELAEMGICPFVDLEGERQLYLFDHGIDLNKVPATLQQKEMMNLKRDKNLVARREKERFLVKCIVEDQKLQGNDPVEFLEENQDKVKELFALKDRQFEAVVARYQQRIQTLGSLTGNRAEVPFDTEAAIAGLMVKDEKAARAAEKARINAEKAKLKAEKLAAKQAANAEKLAAQEAAKAEKLAAKEAANAEKLAAKKAAEAEKLAKAQETLEEDASAKSSDLDDSSASSTSEDNQDGLEQSETSTVTSVKKSTNGISLTSFVESPALPIIGVVGVGGAGFAFMQKVKADKQAEEEERKRQFNLIMGLDGINEEKEEEDDGGDDEPLIISSDEKPIDSKPSTPAPSSSTEITDKKKKKRRGFFSSKKNAREIDLQNLIAKDAIAPDFALLLAKLLTFGAPGRFPAIASMSGNMPMEKFDVEEAKALLFESKSDLGLTDEVSAEQFASVVNCMIIDIIDLASSSLGMKEKKDQVTVDALNVVMDFMDHAASLFDAVANGVVINPVTYGGDLPKAKLEEMFAIYATSGMSSMGGSVTQDRIDTLQQVLNINDKRAEGLIQKAMMKNLMNMMKNGGEGGMEEMLKNMGGMEGMEGMEEMLAALSGSEEGLPGLGDGEDISPEQLKASVKMMKDLIKSGSVSKEELALVREQFKTMYGEDINDLIKAADEEGGGKELGEDGAELLELFKEILKED
mmetsp:Transcript_5061/g.9613  ORF Transcript_5061/g.9613 Transcript_5061/m.9613 type:complete len:861 (+) Transcript_5061:139-2721(+)|eukprot:CAMPEP_0176499092 /NCGR_PEP_ID=MMETSP0200_2-20121128/12719_1 /TAXON_ID=947934 /ORGANISM="Chaetoceros sp., Strain GSL56" /LENGTH=860 /DNA_ID=CAMNT_0017897441 /DNA_START=71 /DNA_END=2653 /DNA_ORIENTATION=-